MGPATGRSGFGRSSDMKPEKWKRNAIFKAVAAGGLDTNTCVIDCGDEQTRVTHVPSASYFQLDGSPGRYSTTAVVGDLLPWTVSTTLWQIVEERVERWANDVKADFDMPDLWVEVQRRREVLTGVSSKNVENTPFTSVEQAEIAKQLRQIVESVRKAHALSNMQILTLSAKVDDLVAASARIGRKDWQLLLYGLLFTLIVTSVVPPGVVYDILDLTLRALGYLFGNDGILPQLPPA